MGTDWKEMLLGDVVELKRGYDLPKKQRTSGNVPVISSSGTSDWHAVSKVKGPGVVTGRYGTIGEVFYCEGDFWPLNTSLYVKDFKGNDVQYIYYFLKTINYHEYSDKAAVPGVNRNHLHMAKVWFPQSKKVQQRIAGILSSLDQKIELNRQTNQTLESVAQALFKSWFVDFDPVIDNALTAGNEIPELLSAKAADRRALREQDAGKASQPYKLPEDISQLFPSRFHSTEQLGWIPEGWKYRTLEEFFPVKTGKKDANFATDDGLYPFFTCSIDLSRYAPGYSFDGPAILLAGNGDFNVKWYIGKFEAYQRTYVLMPYEPDMLGVLFQLMKHCLDDLTIGHKGSVINYLTKGMITGYTAALPNNEVMTALGEKLNNIQRKQSSLNENNRVLTELRNVLLPKLLSGELRIPDAEKMLDAALA